MRGIKRRDKRQNNGVCFNKGDHGIGWIVSSIMSRGLRCVSEGLCSRQARLPSRIKIHREWRIVIIIAITYYYCYRPHRRRHRRSPLQLSLSLSSSSLLCNTDFLPFPFNSSRSILTTKVEGLYQKARRNIMKNDFSFILSISNVFSYSCHSIFFFSFLKDYTYAVLKSNRKHLWRINFTLLLLLFD